MTQDKSLNIKGLFDSNTRITTLRELELQGKSRVKVVNTNQIIGLITRAVENVIERRALTIAEQERQGVIRDSNEEFRKLLCDREDDRKRTSLDRELLENYEREAEDARSQADGLRRKLSDFESNRVDKDSHEQLRSERDEVCRESDLLRLDLEREKSEVESLRRRCEALGRQLADVDVVRQEAARLEHQLAEMDGLRQKASRLEQAEGEARGLRCQLLEFETRLKTLKSESVLKVEETAGLLQSDIKEARRLHETAEEQVRQFEGMVTSQRDLISKYELRIDSYESRVGSYESRIENLADELEKARMKDVQNQGAFTSMVEQMASLKTAIVEKQDASPNLTQIAADQSALTDKLQQLFSDKMEAIEQSLTMKLAGLSVGGSPSMSAVEPDVVLDRLFADNFDSVESNIDTVTVKETQSGDIADQLARLKSLQGGGTGGADSLGRSS